MDAILYALTIVLLPLLLIIMILWWVAVAARPPKRKPSNLLSMTTPRDRELVIKAILRFGLQCGYSIELIDEPTGEVVLGQGANLNSYGFFFPIYVSPSGNGDTLVQVGIKSKLVQYGPIPRREHRRCLNGIKAAILIGD